MAESDLWPEAPKKTFLRMRSENMSKSLLTTSQLPSPKFCPPYRIVAAKHDGDGRF